jgi:hypothetical protein
MFCDTGIIRASKIATIMILILPFRFPTHYYYDTSHNHYYTHNHYYYSSSDVADADLFSKPLITIFRAYGLHLRLLRRMIEREVALTPGVSTLFRRNSMTSKVMTTFSRDTGLYYLV